MSRLRLQSTLLIHKLWQSQAHEPMSWSHVSLQQRAQTGWAERSEHRTSSAIHGQRREELGPAWYRAGEDQGYRRIDDQSLLHELETDRPRGDGQGQAR